MPGRSRPPLPDHPAQRIALIKPSALGDIVHALPVLAALRRRYPAAHITWVVNRGYEPLLRGHPDLDATLPFDRGAARHGLRAAAATWARFLGQLRRHCFDLVLDLQGLLRSGIMVAVSGAARRVGLDSAREGAHWFYTDVVPVPRPDTLHAVERYWLLADALGAGAGPRTFVVPVADEARCWADERLQGYPRPWLALGPGSRWPTKRWPPAHFAALVRQAQRHFGGTPVFVGGADEMFLSRAVRSELTGPALDLTGRTTLPQLAAVLARADLMLANDTGPLHLAAALGRPVVAPYTCTSVRLTGPYGQDRRAVETTVWCQGSYLKRCSRLECMAELTPERVWPVLREVLQQWQSRTTSSALRPRA
jgi:lipopolysaccharide heptosyltransferase I